MKHSAGILIRMVVDDVYKYLLVHPTSGGWKGTLSIPKGEFNPSEEKEIDAAIRETQEEIGIPILLNEILNINNPEVITYINGKGKAYKRVTVFEADVSQKKMKSYLNEDYSLTVRKDLLQKEEVDWAGFLSPKDFMDTKIFWRFKVLFT